MNNDVAKACAQFLKARHGIRSAHAHEIAAAFLGYKSRIALLSEVECDFKRLDEAEIFVPDLDLLPKRLAGIKELEGFDQKKLSEDLVGFVGREFDFEDEAVWVYDSLELYVLEELLSPWNISYDNYVAEEIASTNAVFETVDILDDTLSVTWSPQAVVFTVNATFHGESHPDKAYSGSQIDMNIRVELPRVAGRTFFQKPEIDIGGSKNDDYFDRDF